MGCGTSRSMSPESGNDSRKRGVVTTKKVPAIGVGHPVGGGFRAVDKREAQLVAAESRAKKAASRGMVTPNRVNALNESGKKQELIGKINAVYNVCLIFHISEYLIVIEQGNTVGIEPSFC